MGNHWLWGPLFSISGPMPDVVASWALAIILCAGMLFPLLFLGKRWYSWAVAIVCIVTWCAIGWWIEMSAAC